MDIRKKTVVIMCVALVCLICVLLALSEVVVLDGFSRVEEQSAQKDTNRVLVALGNDINTLDAVAYDWASRDVTREFLLAGTPEKQWSRLEPDTFERLQFNYILLADAKGAVIAGEGFDLDHHTENPVPPHLTTLLVSDQRILSQSQSDFGMMGVLRFPEGPLMIAIRPVFADSTNRLVIGYILMGRYLDTMEISRLSEMAQLPLEMYQYGDANSPADFKNVMSEFPRTAVPFIQRQGKETLAIDAPKIVKPVDSNTLNTYSLIHDLSGNPALILRASIDRHIYEQGLSTTLYFVILVIATGLIFGLVMLVLLERTVLSRILYLSRRVNDIGKKRDFSARVDLTGEDEIGGLAAYVNGMLGELQTSEQQLQNRLLQSEESYRLFFNSITDPVIIYRFGEHASSGAIIEANDAAAEVLGYSREELLSMPPSDIILMDGAEKNAQTSLLPGTDEFVQCESSYRKKDGKMIPVEINARVFDKFGQKAILTIARDITDRKMAEGALKQVYKKLNLLNYVTFNDIRNAVFTIRGYLDLEKGLVKDTKMKDYLEKEETTVKKISRSLDFAKNYQDLGIMPPKWQNVNQIFLYAISHLDFSSLGRTVNLDNLEIYADPLLERVFLTLAENIIRHGKKATQVDISYQKTPDGLRIIFEDNGAGIPDDMKEKIFEREFGTRRGMGLFLAREILEITGITIKETGTFGKGARFELTVPREAFRFSEKDH